MQLVSRAQHSDSAKKVGPPRSIRAYNYGALIITRLASPVALPVTRAPHDGAQVSFQRLTEMFTMYKPNFCAECGAQILRADWHFWTSRRFCENCAPRFRKERILLPFIICVALFATGLALGRAARPATPPLIVERGALPFAPAAPPASTAPSPKSETIYGPDGKARAERPTDPEETVSICGARTQKGTPCQRRVRGTGRCWQHTGLPAMVPLEKRMLTGK
jgi:hypothetical protein